MELKKSGEDYLEAILILEKSSGFVRSIDIANHFGYSKPSVSRAVANLKNRSLITVGDNGELILTDSGRKISEEILERHKILTRFFLQIGVSNENAAKDACLVEHIICNETFECIKKALNETVLNDFDDTSDKEQKQKKTDKDSKHSSKKENKKSKKKKK